MKRLDLYTGQESSRVPLPGIPESMQLTQSHLVVTGGKKSWWIALVHRVTGELINTFYYSDLGSELNPIGVLNGGKKAAFWTSTQVGRQVVTFILKNKSLK